MTQADKGYPSPAHSLCPAPLTSRYCDARSTARPFYWLLFRRVLLSASPTHSYYAQHSRCHAARNIHRPSTDFASLYTLPQHLSHCVQQPSRPGVVMHEALLVFLLAPLSESPSIGFFNTLLLCPTLQVSCCTKHSSSCYRLRVLLYPSPAHSLCPAPFTSRCRDARNTARPFVGSSSGESFYRLLQHTLTVPNNPGVLLHETLIVLLPSSRHSIPYLPKRWSHWHVSLGKSLRIRI